MVELEQSENSTVDEKERTLYVRLPEVIRDDKEVMCLFPEDVKVKLPRQRSRCCHVIFSTIEERNRSLKNMKGRSLKGKKIVLMTLAEKSMGSKKNEKLVVKKEARKKVLIPVSERRVFTKRLHISNIPKGATIPEIKRAFPGCLTAAFLKNHSEKSRSAVVKLETVRLATAYLSKEIPAPEIGDKKVQIRLCKKKSQSARKKQNIQSDKDQQSDNSDSEEEDEIQIKTKS